MNKLFCALALGLSLSTVHAYEDWKSELTDFQAASRNLGFFDKSAALTPFSTKMFDETKKAVTSDVINQFRELTASLTTDGTSVFQLLLIQAQLCDLIDHTRGIESILAWSLKDHLASNTLDQDIDNFNDIFTEHGRLFVNIRVAEIANRYAHSHQKPFPVIAPSNSIPYEFFPQSLALGYPIVHGVLPDVNDGVCEWADRASCVDLTNIEWEYYASFAASNLMNHESNKVPITRLHFYTSLWQSLERSDSENKQPDSWVLYKLSHDQRFEWLERESPTVYSHTFRRLIGDGIADPKKSITLYLDDLENNLESLRKKFFTNDGVFLNHFERLRFNPNEFSTKLLRTGQCEPTPAEDSKAPLISVEDWINQTGHDKTHPILNSEIPQYLHPEGYHVFGFSRYNDLLILQSQLKSAGVDLVLWEEDRLNSEGIYKTVKSLLTGFKERHIKA